MHFYFKNDVVERYERHVEQDIFGSTRVLEPARERRRHETLSRPRRRRRGGAASWRRQRLHQIKFKFVFHAESAPVRQVYGLAAGIPFLRSQKVPRGVALLLDAPRGSDKNRQPVVLVIHKFIG